MLSNINKGWELLVRLFLVFAGLFKAGYVLGLLQDVYYINLPQVDTDMKILYYRYIAAFFGGNLIAGLFYFKIKRSLILALSELMFIIPMTLFEYASTDYCIYLFLFAGGISFLAYPFYASEFVLKIDLHKLFIFLWVALGLGIVYNFCMRKDYLFINFYEGFQIEDTTPYFFGSVSILSFILILILKQKETIKFYAQQQISENEDLNSLIAIIYKPYHHSKILQEFQISSNPTNAPLITQSTQSLDDQTSIDKQQLFFILSTAFCAGVTNVYQQNTQFYVYMNMLFSDDFISTLTDNSYYYSYLVILFGTTILGCSVLIWKKKIAVANIGFILSFIQILQQIIIMEWFNVDSRYMNIVSLQQFIIQFSFIGSVLFYIPFYLLKEHITILYFFMIWLGTVINKVFIYNSQKANEYKYIETQYNSLILECIFAFVGVLVIHKVDKIGSP